MLKIKIWTIFLCRIKIHNANVQKLRTPKIKRVGELLHTVIYLLKYRIRTDKGREFITKDFKKFVAPKV